jgi:hypothetical protein|tara:strand:- start:99 stop:629 length:531 start_codon:yes stop_codon:yes gene_type:complete
MNNLQLRVMALPREVQTKIYILTWRLFWREYVPVTAKVPSWQKRADYVQSQLWMAVEKNIHFLHLPFNTLPENKTWIMGCQCSFCINDEEVPLMEKHCHSLVQYRNPWYFSDKFMPYETSSLWNENLVHPSMGTTLVPAKVIKIFDPLCGSYKENKIGFKLRKGLPIHFKQDYINQ